jgi:hypothetical protein
MSIGKGLPTDIVFVAKHPVGRVNVIIAVPGATPVTTPSGLTVAIPGSLVLHVPGTEGGDGKCANLPVRLIVDSIHTASGPTITGFAYTVTGLVTKHPPGIV